MNIKTVKLLSAQLLIVAGSLAYADELEVVKPGSGQGSILILNQQKRVNTSEFESVAKLFAEMTECKVFASDKEVPATICLRVTDNSSAPHSLLAPEDHWGEINIAKLVDDLSSDKAKSKFLASRARKLAIKSLSILCGGGASQFPDNLMNTATIREMDYHKEQVPVDLVDRYTTYLKQLGITPRVTASYEEACQEGWAPQPTNEFQKAIWDKVHAIPQKPIKIEYNEKRDKGK